MERALQHESGQLLGVLEAAVRAFELVAIVPPPTRRHHSAALSLSSDAARSLRRHFAIELVCVGDKLAEEEESEQVAGADDRPETSDDECDWSLDATAAAQAFPSSLHTLLRALSLDRAARDALRDATATSVSPALAHLALACMQLAMLLERRLSSSTEQDESAARSLRESRQRLREAEDDRKQVGYELAQEQDARARDTARSQATITALETQLRELTRAADDALAATAREREQELQAALSAFEAKHTKAGEQQQAGERGMQRAADVHRQQETDERKRKMATSGELRDVLERYDGEQQRLDELIALERDELARIDAATADLAQVFDRLDADRLVQLEEQRVYEQRERLRRLRDLNVFMLIQKVQAAVRGFLVRRRLRRELLARKKRGRRGKKPPSGAKRKATTAKKKKTPSAGGNKIKREAVRVPTRPPTAATTRGRPATAKR